MKTKYSLLTSIFLFFSIVSNNETPLVILICSYNNEPWIEKNLDSVFCQQYENFRVIIVDDASTDKTLQKYKEYIHNHNLEKKVTLIHNKQRCKKLKNVYLAIHEHCHDDEVVVQVDGDDFLNNPHVFERIDYEYQDPHVWLTYGQFRPVPLTQHTGRLKIKLCSETPEKIIEQNSFRKDKWRYTHVRTFKAWLFKCIRLQDLICDSVVPGFEGQFFPACNDFAIMFPMLEMCHYNFRFIPEILYDYNIENPHTGFRKELQTMIASAKNVRKLPPYQPLEKPTKNKVNTIVNAQADIFICSKAPIKNLQQKIRDITHNISGFGSIIVLHQANNKTQHECKKKLQYFNNITYVGLPSKRTQKHLESYLIAELKKSLNKYVVFCTDTSSTTNQFDCNQCIQWLEKTYAHACYMGSAFPKTINHQHLHKNIYAWKFSQDLKKKIKPFSNMTLYRKNEIVKILQKQKTRDIKSFVRKLERVPVDQNKVGLFVKARK